MVAEVGIGERLRNAREARGLTLQAMEGITRIRAVYLQALEDEQFDRLPGPVYARGFLRAYAAALGLDPDRLVESYAGAFHPPAQPLVGAHPVEIPIRPASPRAPLRRAAAYAGGILLASLIAVGIAGYLQVRQFSQPVPPEAVAPRPPPRPAQPPGPSTPPAPPAPRSAGPLEAARRGPPLSLPRGVTLEVRVSERSWLRVVADGQEVFQGLVPAGETRTWQADRTLTIRVGNSPGVQVLVNGEAYRPRTPGRVWEETFRAP